MNVRKRRKWSDDEEEKERLEKDEERLEKEDKRSTDEFDTIKTTKGLKRKERLDKERISEKKHKID